MLNAMGECSFLEMDSQLCDAYICFYFTCAARRWSCSDDIADAATREMEATNCAVRCIAPVSLDGSDETDVIVCYKVV
jgi:hypothetical protein